VLLVVGKNETDDVSGTPLGSDVAFDVLLSAIELGDHLVGRVAPPRAVAGQLPGAPQLLRWREEDADVVGGAEFLRAEVEQPLDHDGDAELAAMQPHWDRHLSPLLGRLVVAAVNWVRPDRSSEVPSRYIERNL
jgi:hypothetical protein